LSPSRIHPALCHAQQTLVVAEIPGGKATHYARCCLPAISSSYGMYLNGIVLISAILNFETAEFDTGNDLPYILYLPTYTAIAWYHKKLPRICRVGMSKRPSRNRASLLLENMRTLS